MLLTLLQCCVINYNHANKAQCRCCCWKKSGLATSLLSFDRLHKRRYWGAHGGFFAQKKKSARHVWWDKKKTVLGKCYDIYQWWNCTVEPRLSGLFLRSQFGQEYLLVTIKIPSHILFKTTALKGAVKCEGFCSQRAKAALALVVSNEEHLNEFWLDQSCVVARWNFRLYGMKNKEASVTNVYSRSSCLEAQAIRSFHKR